MVIVSLLMSVYLCGRGNIGREFQEHTFGFKGSVVLVLPFAVPGDFGVWGGFRGGDGNEERKKESDELHSGRLEGLLKIGKDWGKGGMKKPRHAGDARNYFLLNECSTRLKNEGDIEVGSEYGLISKAQGYL